MNKKFFHTTPCLLVEQPLGDFYVASIPASIIKDLSFSIPAEFVDETLSGTQRALRKERTAHIAKYVNGYRATLPNSIILAANFTEGGEFVDNEDLRWRVENGELIIPTDTPLASIVDGQHRIDGFRESFKVYKDKAQDMDLLCSIFIDLPAPEQAEIFATINYNQQKVDKSLAYQLFGYSLDEEEAGLWSPDTLAIYLTRIFNDDLDSPFNGCIKYGTPPQEEQANRPVTTLSKRDFKVSTAAMVEGIVKLFSNDPLRDRYEIHKKTLFSKGRSVLNKYPDNSPLRTFYLEGHDRKIFDAIQTFFVVVDQVLWAPAAQESRIITTVGVLAMYDVLKDILIEKGPEFTNFHEKLSLLADVDFSVPLFKTSGAARSQIKNLYKYRNYKMLKSEAGLSEEQEKDFNNIVSRYGEDFERISVN